MSRLVAEFATDLVSGANVRAGAARRAFIARKARHRRDAYLHLLAAERADGRGLVRLADELPAVVTLTRVATHRLDGAENLPMAFKAVADGCADFLGVDDRDPRFVVRHRQRTATAAVLARAGVGTGQALVRIVVETRAHTPRMVVAVPVVADGPGAVGLDTTDVRLTDDGRAALRQVLGTLRRIAHPGLVPGATLTLAIDLDEPEPPLPTKGPPARP